MGGMTILKMKVRGYFRQRDFQCLKSTSKTFKDSCFYRKTNRGYETICGKENTKYYLANERNSKLLIIKKKLLLFFSAGDQTQGFVHAKRACYHSSQNLVF